MKHWLLNGEFRPLLWSVRDVSLSASKEIDLIAVILVFRVNLNGPNLFGTL